MGIYEKLGKIQQELKAPKGQYNSFGKYNYRSCEDILEAVKPLLKANKVVLTLRDEVEQIGDRYYIRAIATLIDAESDGTLNNVALARESENKSGMDVSQITGTASSYARKYALNGLFLIDDTKDADTDEHAKQTGAEPKKASPKQLEYIKNLVKDIPSMLKYYKIDKLEDLTASQASEVIKSKGAKDGK